MAATVNGEETNVAVDENEADQENISSMTPMLTDKNGIINGELMGLEIVEVQELRLPEKYDVPEIDPSVNVDTDTDPSDPNDKDDNDRATWGGQLEFLLTCVGYAVGLGNVWRFPYLCYKNGGGAFLIPYVLMLALVGLPLFYMEMALGQFASLGPITIWKLNPLLKGVGYAAVIVNWMIALYYNVVVAQCVYYFFASMTSELPWVSCNNPWNTKHCSTSHGHVMKSNETVSNDNVTIFGNATTDSGKYVVSTVASNMSSAALEFTRTPSEEYFRLNVLQQSNSIEDFGTINWKLALCLLFAWIVVWLVLLKGIQSLGKVVYFTAIFPYVMLTILLIRGVTLDGALNGIIYYLEPDFSKLADPRVWGDAATQIFYSLSACTGGMIAMSSYNKFKNNCYRDSLIVACINCGTSIFAGFVIFSVLGFMAYTKNTTIEKVADDGPGLAFVVYPEALAKMPVAPLWSVFFFLMMMTLGFGSEFSMVECLLSAFADEFPQYLTKTRLRSFLYRTGVIVLCFLLGLPMVCNGGMWLLNLVDYSVSGFPLLFVGLLECVAVNWIYGFVKFSEDIEMMIGSKPNVYWKICWKYCTPVIIAVVILFNMIMYKEPNLEGELYPTSALVVSWCIALFPMLVMIGWFLYEYCYNGGAFALMKMKMNPVSEWGPANTSDRERHQRYQDIMPITCLDPHLLAKLMGSNISNISDMSEISKQLQMTPHGSMFLQNLTPHMTPAQSLLALQKLNGNFQGRSHRTSECSEQLSPAHSVIQNV